VAVTGDTHLGDTKAEIISALVQKELVANSILAPTIQDVSMYAVKGAETVSFPKAGSFTVENRGTGAAATQQALTFAKDTLTLGFRATVSWLVDSMDALESSVDVEAEYLKRAAAAHGVYLDQKIIAELESVGVATTTAGDISDAVILEMRTALLNRKANRSALRLVISPDQEAIMLAINKFVTADNIGNGQAITTGQMGTIYGVPVFVSNCLTASDQYFMYEASGAALGFQRGPMLDQRSAPEYGAGSVLKVLDQKFGVKGLQIAQQGVASGKSALVVKDNNA
jgi:hypothetical protein